MCSTHWTERPHDMCRNEHASFVRGSGLQRLQQFGQRGLVFPQVALPNDDYPPAGPAQRRNGVSVPRRVAFELGRPELGAGLRKDCVSTPRMPVPEAAVYKYTGPQPGQYNVRLSGKVRAMKPESESVGMQKPAHQHFGLRVLPPYGRHHARPAGGINYVHFAPFRYSVVS